MSFEDRFAITKISETLDYERISISIDEGLKEDGISAVILYIPNTKYPDHEHIELTKKEAENLRNWLNKYLSCENLENKYKQELELK